MTDLLNASNQLDVKYVNDRAAKVIPESNRAYHTKWFSPRKKKVAQIILAKVDLFTGDFAD